MIINGLIFSLEKAKDGVGTKKSLRGLMIPFR